MSSTTGGSGSGADLVPSIMGDLPCVMTTVVPETYRDMFGHMNIRYYMALYDEAEWEMYTHMGMSKAYLEEHGIFDLTHHVQYIHEVRVGHSVSIYFRVLGKSISAKRVHVMLFMVNNTTNTLASTLECLFMHTDLSTRRSSCFLPTILQQINSSISHDKALTWAAPVCGSMDPK